MGRLCQLRAEDITGGELKSRQFGHNISSDPSHSLALRTCRGEFNGAKRIYLGKMIIGGPICGEISLDLR